ncbi:hypothetical protein RRF57_002475 [Xylaria bambusicola]|uniref:Uncharacterized protein n=1 Tax=Xylaria bambusicola TaxID=326684 RepID=A0AAN7U6D6_9PEZI
MDNYIGLPIVHLNATYSSSFLYVSPGKLRAHPDDLLDSQLCPISNPNRESRITILIVAPIILGLRYRRIVDEDVAEVDLTGELGAAPSDISPVPSPRPVSVPIHDPFLAERGQNGSSIPTIIVEALRKQDEAQNEALTATNLGHQQPTPPPDPNAQGNVMAQIPAAPAPGLKRRPSSSPAAASARRRRRRRPRPRQRSVISDPESDPIPPPRPQPAPFYPPRPPSPSFSFLGIKRTKAEKERREQEAKKKRDKREDRRLRKDGQRGRYEKLESPKRAKAPKPKKLSKSPPQRATSAPPLNRIPMQQEQYHEQLYEEQLPSGPGSQRGQHQPRHKGSKQRHKKHHRRLAEQHHRRQQKRRNKFTMRDFFKSLRRKLGNLFRFTMPTPSPLPTQQSAPQYQDTTCYSSPTRDIPYNVQWAQYALNESQIFTGQPRRGSVRRRVDSKQQPLPYFMHGGRSPAASWHSRLSMQGSTRRFTTTVESAPGSGGAPSPAIGGAVTEEIDRITPLAPTPGAGTNTQRHSHQSSTSAISVIARRFMGPFLSEPGDSMIFENGNGSQKRLSWRSHKLLTAGSASRPVTPPSSRNPSPGARGRSKEREEGEGEGEGQSESVPAPIPFPTGQQEPCASAQDRGSRSASPCRVSSPVASPISSPVSSPLASPPLSPDYGLDELFATPPEVNTPATGTPLRLSSPDYGIQRLFSPSPASTGSNFGLRRLFGD